MNVFNNYSYHNRKYGVYLEMLKHQKACKEIMSRNL